MKTKRYSEYCTLNIFYIFACNASIVHIHQQMHKHQQSDYFNQLMCPSHLKFWITFAYVRVVCSLQKWPWIIYKDNAMLLHFLNSAWEWLVDSNSGLGHITVPQGREILDWWNVTDHLTLQDTFLSLIVDFLLNYFLDFDY